MHDTSLVNMTVIAQLTKIDIFAKMQVISVPYKIPILQKHSKTQFILIFPLSSSLMLGGEELKG